MVFKTLGGAPEVKSVFLFGKDMLLLSSRTQGGGAAGPREVLVGGRDAKRGKGPEPGILLKMECCKFAHMSTRCLLVEINLDAIARKYLTVVDKYWKPLIKRTRFVQSRDGDRQ